MQHKRKWAALILVANILCFAVSCTTSISQFKPKANQQISPVGLYIIVSGSDKEADYRAEIYQFTERKITAILNSKGYNTKSLNAIIPIEKVYMDIPGIIWHIDEIIIARQAKEQGCNTVLVAQYYLENLIFYSWTKLYKSPEMVLRVWLVDAQNGKALTENRHIYPCSSDIIFRNVPKNELSMKAKDLQREYIEDVTNRLLRGLVPAGFSSN